ncbi:wax ester/triacylglycerol synthase family O-acyltransferase [Williamsia sp. CHRR-6]|uniref:WS/DGAT/MGAT family O-acyltransferase n=1 Tax=Williamsia sp. CHRR-6 TaxID=2835871 RepID=UPI001BDA4912|nr:wax ester/triacylglycerol synthase family O-acyltransferase [Williamsia sp. CHRR-6]MBT0566115.1 wax ester/triacylglycerol synthase family O-acyltransferase [Williamsia sp. CHRR-6]
MNYVPPTDAIFLLAESRERPMHVGGLQLFRTPDGAGPDFVAGLIEEIRSHPVQWRQFTRRPADPVASFGNVWWTEDDDVDMEYHVRHSAVPRPGRIRELFQLTSRWHGTLLDRHRPLWEMHVVEGIEDNRFAVYTKLHHSLFDGVSALRMNERALSEDPDDPDFRTPWDRTVKKSLPATTNAGITPLSLIRNAAALGGTALSAGGTAASFLPASLKLLNSALRDNHFTTPFDAPRTILNTPIGGSRRFVAQSWEIERVQSVATAAGATLNDVVLTMCSGSIRRYLVEHNALPDKSLTALVPVSLRRNDPEDFGGNAVGAVIASLATDVADPFDRLLAIRESVQSAKRVMSELTPHQILMMSLFNISGLTFTPIPGFVSVTRPPFNIIISNVPGFRNRKYWKGAPLEGVYPASIVMDGQALNITLTSNVDKLDFGITGCRRSVPSLQRFIHHLEDSLAELEKAVGA